VLVSYKVMVFDSAASGGLGAPATGLTAAWAVLKKLSDRTSVSSPLTVAPVFEIGSGCYVVAYDPKGANGELTGVLDFGAGLTVAADRYKDVILTNDTSGNLVAANKGVFDVVDPTTYSAGSLAKALADTAAAVAGMTIGVLTTVVGSDATAAGFAVPSGVIPLDGTFKGRWVYVRNGPYMNQSAVISDSNRTTNRLSLYPAFPAGVVLTDGTQVEIV
jgi:hypothetical protein